jgi:hypothetical protein
MTKNDIDWKQFATELLWGNIVSHKNEDSGYDISESGEIGRWRYSAVAIPYRSLTWNELALELGVLEDLLTPDGHDCGVCSQRNSCSASFKDDPDQERCNGWKL